MESCSVLASAAADGAVRLWSLDGHYIGKLHPLCGLITPNLVGSFGQRKLWTLGDPCSYQHPLAPNDIRLDPTLPDCVDKAKETKSLVLMLDGEQTGVDVGVASNVGVVCEGVTDVEEMTTEVMFSYSNYRH